jgi:hypothetical protein
MGRRSRITRDGVRYHDTGRRIRYEITLGVFGGEVPDGMIEHLVAYPSEAMDLIVHRIEADLPDGYTLLATTSYGAVSNEAGERSLGTSFEWALYQRDEADERVDRAMDRDD